MNVLNLILCHLIGDYVLQSDFIANTKGKIYIIYLFTVHYIVFLLSFYMVMT